MALDVQKLLNWPFEELTHEYSARDTILYALGLGLGSDPMDEEQLRFVYERDLRALPTMAVVLAYPGFWLREPHGHHRDHRQRRRERLAVVQRARGARRQNRREAGDAQRHDGATRRWRVRRTGEAGAEAACHSAARAACGL